MIVVAVVVCSLAVLSSVRLVMVAVLDVAERIVVNLVPVHVVYRLVPFAVLASRNFEFLDSYARVMPIQHVVLEVMIVLDDLVDLVDLVVRAVVVVLRHHHLYHLHFRMPIRTCISVIA